MSVCVQLLLERLGAFFCVQLWGSFLPLGNSSVVPCALSLFYTLLLP